MSSAASLQVNPTSLALTGFLVVIAILISYQQHLGLDKELIIATLRAVVQLTIVGFILKYVIKVDNNWLTVAMVAFIILNAAYNAYRRANGIPHAFRISLIALSTGIITTLLILIFSHAIKFIPAQVITITGMIAGQSMVATGLCYRSLNGSFTDQRQQVLEKLALGGTVKQSSLSIIRSSIKTGMVPTIDQAKTLGLVSLPGMMSGMIFAGIDPVKSIMYQIMAEFMIIGTTSICSFIAVYLAYRQFFNSRDQLTR